MLAGELYDLGYPQLLLADRERPGAGVGLPQKPVQAGLTPPCPLGGETISI
jgi:hypothetical protein